MRVVIAVAISLILVSSAWAEVTIMGEVFHSVEGIDGAIFPATDYPVIVYPAGVEVAVDLEGQYTIVTEEPQRLLIIVTDFDRIFAERVDKMLLREEPPGTLHLKRVIFGENRNNMRLFRRGGIPRLKTYPDTALGAFDPPCHIDVGASEITIMCQLLICTAGEVHEVRVLGTDPPEFDVPEKFVELTRQRLFGLEFAPFFGIRNLLVEVPIAFPARLEYDEEVGWRFK
jgi:hypothetical protein